MATIKFGAIVTDARGKLGGSQLSKNRSGNILQNKCGQRKGATPAQSAHRSNFSYLSRLWRTLDPADIAANNANAANYPYTDKYGATRYFSGYQLLLRSNLNLAVSGLPPISVVPADPPPGQTVSGIDFLIASDGLGTVSGAISWSPDGAAPGVYSLQAFISPALSAGISIYSGSLIFAGSQDVYEGELDFDASNVPAIDTYPVGSKVFLNVYVMHNATGIVVSNYNANTIVYQV